MKEMLTKNLGLKLLALVVSILLWIVVVNINEPIDKEVFTGIPVAITHPEIITNPGNTFRVSEDSKTVSVTVWAQRSVLDRIKPENIRATADMKELMSRTMVPVRVAVLGFSGEKIEATADPINVYVTIEASQTKNFPISAASSGTVRDGYVIGELTADPEKVEISGPESVVSSIEKVVAEVDVSGMSRDSEVGADMVLYDGAGKVIDSTLVETNLGEEGLTVKVKLLHTKSVPVRFDTSGIRPAPGYQFSGITVQPETIQIMGTSQQLTSIDKIEVDAEELAETGLTKSTEKSVDITPYLPYGVETTDENTGTSVLVKIVIEKYGTRTVEFPVASISLLNVPKDYTVSYETTGNIEIIVSGSDELLENFRLEQGTVSVNLVNYKEEGRYTVPVQVTLGKGLELENDITVDIELVKNNGGNDG